VSPRLFVLGVTVLITLATVVKPLHIDDGYTVLRVRQIVETPTDPSGFEVFWKQWPQPATESPWPLVIPYWLAGISAIVGERPWAWKLSLFPFYWVFVRSLFTLFQRFATRYRHALVFGLALSPTFLPGVNMMLDLPTIGLTLAAATLFISGVDRSDLRRALLAGLVAGLAAQCKYNGLVAFPIILLYGWVHDRVRWSVLACALGSLLFWSFEGLLWLRYGESQFLWSLAHSFPMKSSKVELLAALPSILGATLIWLVALLAAIAPLSVLVSSLTSLAVLGGFFALHRAPIEAPLFYTFGGLVIAVVGIATTLTARGQPQLREVGQKRIFRFLIAWLVLEIAASIVIAPFPAVRRTQGIAVVATLLVARSLTMSRRAPSDTAVRIGAGLAVVLGLLYYSIDYYEATVSRSAAATAGERARPTTPEGSGWYTGHWGFDYYANLAGLRPLVPDHSLVRIDERVVIPATVARQRIETDSPEFERVGEIDWDDPLRLTTVMGYYSGRFPMRHRKAPRFTLSLHQAKEDVVPRTSWPPRYAIRWYEHHSGWESSGRAVPYFAWQLRWGDPKFRVPISKALATYGLYGDPPVIELIGLIDAGQPRVRIAAIEALASVASDDPVARERVEKALGDRHPTVRQAAETAMASFD